MALYNTALGLIVAIPALIFWRFFRRRVDDYVAELEFRAASFLDAILPPRRGDGRPTRPACPGYPPSCASVPASGARSRRSI